MPAFVVGWAYAGLTAPVGKRPVRFGAAVMAGGALSGPRRSGSGFFGYQREVLPDAGLVRPWDALVPVRDGSQDLNPSGARKRATAGHPIPSRPRSTFPVTAATERAP